MFSSFQVYDLTNNGSQGSNGFVRSVTGAWQGLISDREKANPVKIRAISALQVFPVEFSEIIFENALLVIVSFD